MVQVQLLGKANPILRPDEEYTNTFGNGDPKKPLIVIDTVHIHPSSDIFDPKHSYVGLMVYLRKGQRHFELNGVESQTGNIYIKASERIKKEEPKRRRRGDYVHGRLFRSIFQCWPGKKRNFVGAGFSYHENRLKFNSRTFNTMNPNNNDDGYSNTFKGLEESEKKIIETVFHQYYANHKWLRMKPTERIPFEKLKEDFHRTLIPVGCDINHIASSIHPERTLRGQIQRFNGSGDYGFIKCDGIEKDIFFHVSAVSESLLNKGAPKPGDKVEFHLIFTSKGLRANQVHSIQS